MQLIGRNNDLIGQILEVFEDKKEAEKKGSELTSGTMKLMAIFSQERGSKTWGIGEESLR